MLEADDVVLMQTPVNLNLRHELLLGTCLSESGLGNDLGRRDSLVLQVGKLKATSETSLTQELALQVPLDADLTIVLDHLLFNDGLCSIDAFLWLVYAG